MDGQVIPKHFHTMWVQGPPLPETHQEWFDSWLKHNPDWQHTLWAEPDYLELVTADGNLKIYETAVNHAQRAEIARYSILYHHGGIVLDADFECLRPWDFLDGIECFAPEESVGQYTMSMLGAVPKHPAVKVLVVEVEQSILWQRTAKKPQNYGAGPHMIQRLWGGRSDVTKFTPRWFFPYNWKQEKPDVYRKNPYAVHHWTATWKNKE